MGIGSVLPENWCAPEGGIFHRRCPKVGSGAEVILCSLRGGWFGGETQRSILRWAEQSERGLIVFRVIRAGSFAVARKLVCTGRRDISSPLSEGRFGGGRLFYVRCAEVGSEKVSGYFVRFLKSVRVERLFYRCFSGGISGMKAG